MPGGVNPQIGLLQVLLSRCELLVTWFLLCLSQLLQTFWERVMSGGGLAALSLLIKKAFVSVNSAARDVFCNNAGAGSIYSYVS